MNIENQIKSIINKRTKLYLSKLHLERLHTQLKEVYKEKRRLERVLKKEYDDVVKLERLSVGRLFKKVLGDLEEHEKSSDRNTSRRYSVIKNASRK